MIVVQRTHLLRRDRDWLPAGVRRAGWVVSGSVWGGAGLAIGGALVAAPVASIVLWKGLVLGGVGAAVAGERAGHAMFARQLRKLARGEVELAEVGQRAEGELVVVRGTVDAAEPLTGLLRDTPGVYRRMVFAAGKKWVHEAAVDFALIDDRGHRILIQAGGARWMAPGRELMTYPAVRFTRADVPDPVRRLVAATGQPTIEAAERVLTPGTAVQVVGYKTASADATGEAAGYRLPPQRATLRSGPEVPLVITSLEDLA